MLAAAPYHSFRWETPSSTVRTVERPFECVVLDDPSLDCAPEPWVFAAYFANQTEENSVLAFANLEHDAVLVVARRRGGGTLTDISPLSCAMLRAYKRMSYGGKSDWKRNVG